MIKIEKKLLLKSRISINFLLVKFDLSLKLKYFEINSSFRFFEGLTRISLKILFLTFLKKNSNTATRIAPEIKKIVFLEDQMKYIY